MNDAPDLKRQTASTSNSSEALEPSSFEPSGILYAGEDRKSGLLMEYFRILARYRWLIAVFALSGVVASFLLNFDALPVYRARTSLDIQAINSDFMNMKAVAPTGNGADPASDDYVQTQIKLLQSDTLLQRTVDRLRSEPHPQYIEQMDLASRVERALHLVRHKRLSYQSLVEDAATHVTVKPIGITRLVEITCDSWSAETSAKFCNTLVDQFREGDLEMRGNESKKTSDWLTQQVADVRTKAEESEKQLEAATGGNNLVLSQESTGVEEDRLRQMQGEYVKAEADRMAKEAAAGIGSSSSPGMDPDLGESAAYRQDEQKLADLRVEVAKLVPPLTEENDKVIHLRSQIKAVEADMVKERTANAAHLRSDYETALHREAMLAGAYRHEEATVSSDLGKASRVSLLRREVESEQQLYQTLLQLAREAGFASAIHASTIRVVDAAKAATVPFSPRRSSSAVSGLLFGTLCGVCVAFFTERNTAVFRVPGDTERYLGLRELGVIPSSRRVRRAFASMPLGSLGGEVITPRDSQLTLSNWTENFSIVAEAYRNATTSIMLSEHPREKGRVYVISSPNAGEGKTTVISNMGVALSKSKLRVLLVDGDLRKPCLHKVLQVPNEFGLRNLLRGETGVDPDSKEPIYQSTAMPNLFVLPAGQGSEEVVELLHSSHTGDLMKRLRRDFDVVIIDTPPMLHMADTRILASHSQGAILVVRAGITTRDEALRARDLFDQDRVRMVGTILNDFNPDKNGLPDYYKSYHRYMDEVATTATGTVSWFEWLFTRDRRVMQPVSDSGKMPGAVEIDYADLTAAIREDAVQDDVPNETNGAMVRVDSRPLYVPNGDGSSADHRRVVVPRSQPTFLMRILTWASTPESAREVATISDEQSAVDAPGVIDEPTSIYEPRTQERRRTDRQVLPNLVAYYWDGGAPRAHDIRDISSTGLYLFTEVRWYPGTLVMISLQKPGAAANDPDRSITVNAKVVRFGTDGIGFAFVMPDKQSSRGAKSSSARGVQNFGVHGADRNAFYRFMRGLPEDQN